MDEVHGCSTGSPRSICPTPSRLDKDSLDIRVHDISAIVHLSLEPNVALHVNTNMYCGFSLSQLSRDSNK